MAAFVDKNQLYVLSLRQLIALALLIPSLISLSLYSLSLSLSANSKYLCSAASTVLQILLILRARLYTLDVVVEGL